MYLALARKYRPQTFGQLIGQPHITKTLQNAIALDKLYPTLIFSGMKGVGKTSASRILAKALNCGDSPVQEPCNNCPTCQEITEDKSADYIEIDGASNNGVEEVRNLKEKVKYKPFKNRFRVVVIDEVHMLSNSAWNALLKTIEEPPEHTYFVMATTDFHKIPATIVSRCQQFEFKRIPFEVIVNLLKEICAKESVTITDYSLYLVARASGGSLRDAKKILDQAIAIAGGEVTDKDVVDILGVIEEEVFIELTGWIFNADRKAIIQKVHELSERGMDLRFFYTEYLKFFRNLLVVKSLGEAEGLHDLNPDNLPRIKEVLADTREVELLRYFNAAKDLEMVMKTTENPRIMLEYLFLKLTYFPSLVPIEELIQSARDGVLPAPAATVGGGGSKGAPQAATGAGGTAKKPGELADVIAAVEDEKPRLASSLKSAEISLSGDLLLARFPGDLDIAHGNAEKHRNYLSETAARVLGRPVKVEITLDTRKSNAGQREDRKKELENDPKINSLADKIKGKVVSVDKI